MMRSPGCSVTREESISICSATVKIILPVCESCISSSPTHSLMPRFCGSPTSAAGTIHGPSGQAPSKHFWLTQSKWNGLSGGFFARRITSRADRSLPMV